MIYLDHAATTPVHPEALEAMIQVLRDDYGNPSGVHGISRIARDRLEDARERVATALGCSPREIVFTSGGTEANAIAILGIPSLRTGSRHIVTTAIEHPSVRNTVAELGQRGHQVTSLKPDEYGVVTAQQVAESISDQTALVSVMLGNNEIGTIQPYEQIAAVCEHRGIPFHCDAVQGVGKLPLALSSVPFTSAAISGHKFGAPKGIGVLYVRRGHKLNPLIPGGGQESGLRSGTQNVAAAVALAVALERAVRDLPHNVVKLRTLQQTLTSALTFLPGVQLTGHPELRLPHIASFILESADEEVCLDLAARGICASTGSACSAGTVQASPVLLACGYSDFQARRSIRLSVGKASNDADVAAALQELTQLLAVPVC